MNAKTSSITDAIAINRLPSPMPSENRSKIDSSFLISESLSQTSQPHQSRRKQSRRRSAPTRTASDGASCGRPSATLVRCSANQAARSSAVGLDVHGHVTEWYGQRTPQLLQ